MLEQLWRVLPVFVLVGVLIPVGGVARSGSTTQQIDFDAYPIQRIGVDNDDGFPFSRASSHVSISSDGRFIAFEARGSLVPEDINDERDVYVYDRETRSLEFIGIPNAAASHSSEEPVISADGRFVTFHASDTDLVPGDDDDAPDVLRYERATGEYIVVSRAADEEAVSGSGGDPVINADGSVIAFESSDALVSDDMNNAGDLYVADLNVGSIERIGGSDGRTRQASLSADGRYVAFHSEATDLVEGDTNDAADVFVLDRDTGEIEIISQTEEGVQGNGESNSPALSSDGRYVVYESEAPNLTGDPSGSSHIILHDRQTGTSQLVDLDNEGDLAQGESSLVAYPETASSPAGRVISDDHRYVVFASVGANMPGYVDSQYDDLFIYRRDLELGMTELVSRSMIGVGGDFRSSSPTLSADGRFVAFTSESSNLTYFDDNEASDIFIRDMEAEYPITPFEITHNRTDLPVDEGEAQRTWTWAPAAFTEPQYEPYGYAEISNVLPGEKRAVQYFDKSRMEITDPGGDPNTVWYVTNGLLVMEMITGDLQISDDSHLSLDRARINVAGDPDDPNSPTYATFAGLLDAPPHPLDQPVIARVDREGNVTNDDSLAAHGVEVAIVDDVTGHAIVAPFWEFMNSEGTIWDGQSFIQDSLFESEYFATGRPVSEAYWATVRVGGTERDVLMQCFERRCLTFTPGNPEGFIVEAGNVGLHYYQWRYSVQPLAPDLPGSIVYTDGAFLNVVDHSGARQVFAAPAGQVISEPVWSPDNSQIAFAVRTVDGSADLYIVDADGSNAQSIVSDGRITDPSWSPDGTQLVFTSDPGQDTFDPIDTIETINVDGTGRTTIGTGLRPRWSPEGDRIAFIVEEPDHELHTTFEVLMTMDPDGENAVEVTRRPQAAEIQYGGINDYAWSPDATQFVYVSSYTITIAANVGYRIYVVNTDGTGDHEVKPWDPTGSNPGWSPDGSHVTYSRQHVIYMVDQDGAGTRGVLWDFGQLIYDYDWAAGT